MGREASSGSGIGQSKVGSVTRDQAIKGGKDFTKFKMVRRLRAAFAVLGLSTSPSVSSIEISPLLLIVIAGRTGGVS